MAKSFRILRISLRESIFIVSGFALYVVTPIFLSWFNSLITFLQVYCPGLFSAFKRDDAFMGLDKLQRLVLAFSSMIFINSCVFLMLFIFWRWAFNYMTSGDIVEDINSVRKLGTENSRKICVKPFLVLFIYFSLFYLFVLTLNGV